MVHVLSTYVDNARPEGRTGTGTEIKRHNANAERNRANSTGHMATGYYYLGLTDNKRMQATGLTDDRRHGRPRNRAPAAARMAAAVADAAATAAWPSAGIPTSVTDPARRTGGRKESTKRPTQKPTPPRREH